MEEIFKILGLFATSSVVAFGFIKYMSQKIFDNYLVKKIETHKSELSRLTISHQIKYSSLHKERAIVIKDLYIVLYHYKLTILEFFNVELNDTNPKAEFQNRIGNWTKYAVEFNSMFHRNKIFFSEEHVDLINKIDNEMDKISGDTKAFLSQFELVSKQIEAIQNKDKDFMALKLQIEPVLNKADVLERKLENEFREILGVNSK